MLILVLQDNSTELENLQKEAEEVIAKARSEASAKLQAAKKATEDEIQAAADEHKKVLPLRVPGVGDTLLKRLVCFDKLFPYFADS